MEENQQCSDEVLAARLIMCQPAEYGALKWIAALAVVLEDQKDDPEGIEFKVNGHILRFSYEGFDEDWDNEDPED